MNNMSLSMFFNIFSNQVLISELDSPYFKFSSIVPQLCPIFKIAANFCIDFRLFLPVPWALYIVSMFNSELAGVKRIGVLFIYCIIRWFSISI